MHIWDSLALWHSPSRLFWMASFLFLLSFLWVPPLSLFAMCSGSACYVTTPSVRLKQAHARGGLIRGIFILYCETLVPDFGSLMTGGTAEQRGLITGRPLYVFYVLSLQSNGRHKRKHQGAGILQKHGVQTNRWQQCQ